MPYVVQSRMFHDGRYWERGEEVPGDSPYAGTLLERGFLVFTPDTDEDGTVRESNQPTRMERYMAENNKRLADIERRLEEHDNKAAELEARALKAEAEAQAIRTELANFNADRMALVTEAREAETASEEVVSVPAPMRFGAGGVPELDQRPASPADVERHTRLRRALGDDAGSVVVGPRTPTTPPVNTPEQGAIHGTKVPLATDKPQAQPPVPAERPQPPARQSPDREQRKP